MLIKAASAGYLKFLKTLSKDNLILTPPTNNTDKSKTTCCRVFEFKRPVFKNGFDFRNRWVGGNTSASVGDGGGLKSHI